MPEEKRSPDVIDRESGSTGDFGREATLHPAGTPTPSAVSPPPFPAAEHSQASFGEYEILGKLGEGGMGQVFRARHRSMRRLVAIKLLPSGICDSEAAVKRFQREVEAAAKLLHPNIVAAFDAGQHEGRQFLVMEYVPGQDLAAVVDKRGPLGIDEAVSAILQAARGLAYAHGKGVVHRDIKPANLLIDDEGNVKILDMGLARFDDDALANVDVEAGLTRAGQVMGTIDYMAPEQAADTHQADARSDLYSLGCTLFRLLTNKPVYGGKSLLERMVAHRERPIPSLKALRSEVPDEIEAIFRKLVEKKPEDRFQSAAELIAALEAWQTGPVVPPPAPPVPPPLAGSPARRSSRWIATAALGLILIIAISAVALIGDPLGLLNRMNTGVNVVSVPPKEPPPIAAAPFDAETAAAHQAAWARHLGIEITTKTSQGERMILIPPGEFQMGAPNQEIEEILKDAKRKITASNVRTQLPQHKVTLTRPFRLATTEVTYSQFSQFVQETSYESDAERDGDGGLVHDAESGRFTRMPGLNWAEPGHPHTNQTPVTIVTWNDAVEFCNWLSRHENLSPYYVDDDDRNWRIVPGPGYRLPTEAEWEFACRAGTETRYFWGDDQAQVVSYDWDVTSSEGRPHPVRSKEANPFGLFDMAGNVHEWVFDWYAEDYYANSPPSDPTGPESGTLRVQRGGSWSTGKTTTRSAHRLHFPPTRRNPSAGFRIAQSVLPPEK